MAASRVSACPLDCPDACSLDVTVDGGMLVALDGDRRNPFTDGFICAKVRNFARHAHGDARLRAPLVRTGPKGEGRFVEVSWEVALELVATRLREVRARHGGEAILPLCYGGSNGALSQDCVDARLFRRLGASRLLRTVCAAPTGAAAGGLYGKMPGVALPDYEHTKLAVLWGCNPSASGIHLVPVLQRARAAGAALVVVDPRRTPLAKQADLHLALRPGTDLPVALAVIHWLFAHGHADAEFLAAHATGVEQLRERAAAWTIDRAAAVAGLEPAALERFAALYAERSPAAIRCGWGPERNRNGGSATAAILALPAVAGKFGVRGGGYTMSNGRTLPLSTEAAIAEPEPATRTINMNQVGRVLEAGGRGGVWALFVYNCNPLATLPEQNRVRRGLERADLFTVVFEQVMTDTARYADVVLPATTFLEHDELRSGYGAMAVQRARPAIAAVGLARPNFEVFTALCDRLGLSREGDPRGAEALCAAIVQHSALPEPAAAALVRDDIGTVAGGVQFVDVFPRTPDGKIHLCPAALDAEAPTGLYGYREAPTGDAFPLIMISPALARQISSTFGQLDASPAHVHVHPHDAAARALADGQRIRVFNERGEVWCRLRVDDAMRPGVVSLAKGLWAQRTDNGATANALCPDDLSDLGGGATFNDARVQIEAAPAGADAPAGRQAL